jgi:tetratricopeptide (TPR) repeat protein
MQPARSFRRAAVLGFSLFTASIAAGPLSAQTATRDGRDTQTGAYGAYLAGRFATAQSDPARAASEFLHALAIRPGDDDLQQEAFLAGLMAGRPEAASLARQMPESQAAQLYLANEDILAGRWSAAEQRFASLPREGLTQLLQPILVAWTEQGAGHIDQALATLRPFLEGQRLHAVYALNAALIADLGNRAAEATRLYGAAQSEFPGPTLRLAQILASWDARQGHLAEAERTIASLAETSPETAIALPGLAAALRTRPVSRASEGIAEAYLALAAALREQEAGDYAMVLLRLSLTLRPDFTAARLLAAEILETQHHLEAAQQMLALIPASDPLAPVVAVRQAFLTDELGHTEKALHDFQALARAYPNSPLPDLHAGDILRVKQHYPEAIAAYNRAIARIPSPGPNDWPVFYERGIAYERSHQWQLAEADFRHALALSPDQPLILNYLGYSWADMGRHLAQAQQMIQKAAERRPNDGAIVDSLGWVLLRQGDTAQAVKELERAVEMQPEDSTINGHLGDAYWAAGRKLEASFQWRRALTLNPEPDDAAKLEARLQGGHPAAVVAGPTAPSTLGE